MSAISAFPWLEALVAHINKPDDDPKTGPIGICTGTLIQRDTIRPMFHSMIATAYHATSMEDELFDLIFTLFDRFGRFKSVFQDHPVKRGSGVWGKELDVGSIVVLDNLIMSSNIISVDETAIGIVNWFFERARAKSGNVLIVQPTKPCFQWMENIFATGAGILGTWVNRPADPPWHAASFFFTLMGFRRIGNTDYFGLPLAFFYESFGIGICDDLSLKLATTKSSRLSCFEDLQKGIVIYSDTAITRKLERFRHCISPDDPDWFLGNEARDTILHTSATSMKPLAVRWILDNFSQSLTSNQNAEGETPLEALLSKLEGLRARYVTTDRVNQTVQFLSDHWREYSDASSQCVALLLGLKSPTPNDFVRIKRGCTCGKCIKGFLSPRMCAALEYASDTALSELHHNINDSQKWIESNREYFIDFPRKFQSGVSKPQVRRGLIYLWECIRDCVVNYKLPPSELNIRVSLKDRYNWPYSLFDSGVRQSQCDSIVHYLRCGKENGHDTMKAAAVMIFRKAIDSDELIGDSSFVKNYKGSYSGLPECRNDHEFGYVSTQCGYEHDYVPRSMKGIVGMLKEKQKRSKAITAD
ncbi:hypothetical protein B7463_g1166, partial [Scytalidium lignicola]